MTFLNCTVFKLLYIPHNRTVLSTYLYCMSHTAYTSMWIIGTVWKIQCVSTLTSHAK